MRPSIHESLLEVACYSGVIGDYHEGVRVDALDDLAQVRLLVLGYDGHEHV